MGDKFILDACCGGRQFWFDKTHPNTIFIDIRKCEKGHNWHRPNHEVNPDIQMDFRKLDFPDNSFKMVIFDPPHILHSSDKGVIEMQYGALDKDNWSEDLKKGFDECWRVLEDYGVLIFKWNEARIKKSDVLKILAREPLFGHSPLGNHKSHWLCFMKIPKGGSD